MAFWFDYQHVLDHGCLFNFIVGERGNGKTYGFKKLGFKNYLKTGKKFMYVRRYEKELNKAGASFATDIKKEFTNYEFDYTYGDKGSHFFATNMLMEKENRKKEHIGYGMTLSTGSYDKSVSFEDVDLIAVDEFIIAESGNRRYLRDEVNAFLNLYETVARMRDVPVFFLANAITAINPYFEFFNISLPYNKTWAKKGDIYIEVTDSADYREAKRKTRFGAIIEGTDFARSSIDNKFVLDNESFIMKKTDACKPFHTIHYNGKSYGIWWDMKNGKMFLSLDTDSSVKFQSALTADDHQPNRFYYKSGKKIPWLGRMLTAYENGYLYFESQSVKGAGLEIIKFIRG